jgi:adenylosuccinate lyase
VILGPDATIALDCALMRLAGMMEKLTVYPERMDENLEGLGGVVHSQKVLLALTQAGMSREAAYAAVQQAAMATWLKLGKPDARRFRENLLSQPDVAAVMDSAALDAAMDPQRDFRHVETIFARVFGT